MMIKYIWISGLLLLVAIGSPADSLLAGPRSPKTRSIHVVPRQQNQSSPAKAVSPDAIQIETGSPRADLHNEQGMQFVWMPAGRFWMRTDTKENVPGLKRSAVQTRHRVALTRGFYIQTTEVTQGQWQAVMGTNPAVFSDCGPDCPVEYVSWNDARKFIRKLNRNSSAGKYALPTEAQWAHAARNAAAETNLKQVAWYRDNSGSRTQPVGTRAPDAQGLYDMLGNVWEWCRDSADDSGQFPVDTFENGVDPRGKKGPYRVIRGGSWGDPAANCRPETRGSLKRGDRSYSVGFRLVLTPKQ